MFMSEHQQIDPEMFPGSPNSSYEYNDQVEYNSLTMTLGSAAMPTVMFEDAYNAAIYQEPQGQYPTFDSPQMHGYSTASGQSSNIGSPQSIQQQQFPGQLGSPLIAGYDNYMAHGSEYSYQSAGMDDFALFQPAKPMTPFVDPAHMTHYNSVPQAPTPQHPSPQYSLPQTFASSASMSQSPHNQHGSQSPYEQQYYQGYSMERRPSLTSNHSYGSLESDSKDKPACPECGKRFKDMKAHMMTHQNVRPEKCPVVSCSFNRKGFARKYDQQRHTLTHYKGTMVCPFCPGAGTAAEKSFNRADVFKRHLTTVHGAITSPPNSKKGAATVTKKTPVQTHDGVGRCLVCSDSLSVQEFYDHLDDCVLRYVQKGDPAEDINAANLAEVVNDSGVHETLRKNALPTTVTDVYSDNEVDDNEDDDEDDDDFAPKSRKRVNKNPANGVQKSRGLTYSKGGFTLNTKGRKKRKNYPSSWGCSSEQMKMKKRVMCVFDGQRRLWKDDLMLDTDYELRFKLRDEKHYITDLDYQTLKRTEAFHDATEEEKGPWISDDLSTVSAVDIEKLMAVNSADEK